MLRIRFCQWGWFVKSQCIDTASDIDTILIRVVPGSLRQRQHTGHDPFGDLGGNAHPAPIIIDFNQIPMRNTPFVGILGIDPQSLRSNLISPVDVAISRVGSLLVMMANHLQGILINQWIGRGLPGRIVNRKSRDSVSIGKLPVCVFVVKSLTEDLYFA